MKKSEALKLEAEQCDNDLIAFGLHKKAMRQEKVEIFLDKYFPILKEKHGAEWIESEGCCIIPHKTVSHWKIKFYPKANRILFTGTNVWKNYGLNYIIKNFINE